MRSPNRKRPASTYVNDGEFGHNMGWDYDYGSWWSYVVRRLNGVEVEAKPLWMQTLTAQTKNGLAPKDFVVGEWLDRRDWTIFHDAYMDPRSGCALPEQFMTHYSPVVKGAISYKGQDAGQTRHRQPQGRARGHRHQGRRLDELGRAGKLLAHGKRALQDRRGADVRLRGCDARGVQGDRRRRTDPPARRSGDRRELGSAEGGAERRGLPALFETVHRRAQPLDPRAACRRKSASTSAGEAGTARTPPTSR